MMMRALNIQIHHHQKETTFQNFHLQMKVKKYFLFFRYISTTCFLFKISGAEENSDNQEEEDDFSTDIDDEDATTTTESLDSNED